MTRSLDEEQLGKKTISLTQWVNKKKPRVEAPPLKDSTTEIGTINPMDCKPDAGDCSYPELIDLLDRAKKLAEEDEEEEKKLQDNCPSSIIQRTKKKPRVEFPQLTESTTVNRINNDMGCGPNTGDCPYPELNDLSDAANILDGEEEILQDNFPSSSIIWFNKNSIVEFPQLTESTTPLRINNAMKCGSDAGECSYPDLIDLSYEANILDEEEDELQDICPSPLISWLKKNKKPRVEIPLNKESITELSMINLMNYSSNEDGSPYPELNNLTDRVIFLEEEEEEPLFTPETTRTTTTSPEPGPLDPYCVTLPTTIPKPHDSGQCILVEDEYTYHYPKSNKTPPLTIPNSPFPGIISPHSGGRQSLNLIPNRRRELGEVHVLGTNASGQLGLGHGFTRLDDEPEMVVSLSDGMVDIACGRAHTLALRHDGTLYSWGCNRGFALGRTSDGSIPKPILFPHHHHPVDIVRLAACGSVSAVLTKSGHVYAWGSFEGECESSDQAQGPHPQVTPRTVIHRTPKLLVDPQLTDPVTHIAATALNLFLVTNSGSVFAITLVDPHPPLTAVNGPPRRRYARSCKAPPPPLPPQVMNLTRLPIQGVTAVYGGTHHALALTVDGTVLCWGANGHHQCGVARSTTTITWGPDPAIQGPTVSPALTALDVRSIAAGDRHTVILTSGNRVFTVGEDAGPGAPTPTPTLVDLPHPVTCIASGPNHRFAICSDRVFAWATHHHNHHSALGSNVTVQLDTHSHSPSPPPSSSPPTFHPVAALADRSVVGVAAGAQHSVFLVRPIPDHLLPLTF